MPLHLERALFVVAPRDSGKSTALRSLFMDRRLGTQGVVPKSNKLNDIYWLSNERRLYLRLTSPHESNESIDEFILKSQKKMGAGRWCMASALQPDKYKRMPDAVEAIRQFIKVFAPERSRIALLSPNRHGDEVRAFLPGRDLRQELLSVGSGVEVMCLDARTLGTNGLLLADFFDFT